MMTQYQGRKRLRISDQDALLKWCRSNGFSLTQQDNASSLAFNINLRNSPEKQTASSDFVLEVNEKGFAVFDPSGEGLAQGKELRGVLKEISLQLAKRHSAAS